MSSKGKKRKIQQSHGEPPPKRLSRRRLVIEDDESERAEDSNNIENITTSTLNGDEQAAVDAAIARSLLDVEAEDAGSQEDSDGEEDGEIIDDGEEVDDDEDSEEDKGVDSGDDAVEGKDTSNDKDVGDGKDVDVNKNIDGRKESNSGKDAPVVANSGSGKDSRGVKGATGNADAETNVEASGKNDAISINKGKERNTGQDNGDETDASEHSAHSVKANKIRKAVSTAKQTTFNVAKLKKPKANSWGYSKKVNGRIATIRSMSDSTNYTYFIDKLPNELEWVPVMNPAQSRYYALGVKGSKTPVKIWFVGTLVNMFFFDASGDPRSQITLNVRLLSEGDTKIANNVIKRFTKDRTGSVRYDDVRFSRWMTIRRPGETRVVAETFSEAYNALEGVKLPRSRMSFMAPEDLKNGDLLLVEATVHRYHKHKDGNKTVYNEWIANYNLNWLALLDDTLPVDTSATAGPSSEVEISF